MGIPTERNKEKKMINGFIHFGVSVKNLDTSLSFLCEGLGFVLEKTFERPEAYTQKVTGVAGTSIRAALISGYGVVLEILEYTARIDRPQKAIPVHFPGAAHICLEVDNMEETIESLTRRGAAFQKEITVVPFEQGNGNRVIYGRDPDEIAFELVEKKKKEN